MAVRSTDIGSGIWLGVFFILGFAECQPRCGKRETGGEKNKRSDAVLIDGTSKRFAESEDTVNPCANAGDNSGKDPSPHENSGAAHLRPSKSDKQPGKRSGNQKPHEDPWSDVEYQFPSDLGYRLDEKLETGRSIHLLCLTVLLEPTQ